MVVADIFKIVLDRIQDRIPEIKHVDYYNEQLMTEELEEEDLPFNRPAVLIEFPAPVPQQLGNRKMARQQDIILHLWQDTIQEASSAKSKRVRERTIDKHTGLIDALHRELHGLNNNGTDGRLAFGSLQYLDATTGHSFDNVIEHILLFTTRLENTAAMRPRRRVTPRLVITPDIQSTL